MAILKNIIFDLGVVLINIDYKKTEKAFINLGFQNFSEMYNQFSANEIFEKLETGNISNADFYAIIMKLSKQPITETQIEDAWNEILLDWRIESVAYLKKLSESYNLYLLSNTNAIHQAAFFKSLKNQTGITDLNSFFTKAYYSHEVHLRKPNTDIFEFVLKDASILAKETLFIDDSYNNIDTAKAMGFKTHLLLPNERIEHLDYQLF
jgi:glucose-1-phosphatase